MARRHRGEGRRPSGKRSRPTDVGRKKPIRKVTPDTALTSDTAGRDPGTANPSSAYATVTADTPSARPAMQKIQPTRCRGCRETMSAPTIENARTPTYTRGVPSLPSIPSCPGCGWAMISRADRIAAIVAPTLPQASRWAQPRVTALPRQRGGPRPGRRGGDRSSVTGRPAPPAGRQHRARSHRKDLEPPEPGWLSPREPRAHAPRLAPRRGGQHKPGERCEKNGV